ncbi:putative serpin-like protein [Dinothrombium tinctorium]|uniref:Putative serpin-like protein n=1 Tax=Dinothrombium tinctorium TaxID=1965070 RepID=A0A3S3P335_9ACAR|nr:putative serpin-like protein [Dinothrombium tinctorium]RWS10999.1 putative serpin-like protein [Dinothrombium tinctorium]
MSLSKALNTFAFDFLRALATGEDNVFFSPLTIYVCLNAAAVGAIDQTAEELFHGLRSDSAFDKLNQVHLSVGKAIEHWTKKSHPYIMYLANKVLISSECTVREEYKRNVKEHYKTSVEEVDFINNTSDVLKSCNQWVDKTTNGMIKSILSSLKEDTLFIILNAVYFSGKWCTQFDPQLTSSKYFYNNDNETQNIKVPTMFHESIHCRLYLINVADEEVDLLELPYLGNMCFTLLLPRNRNVLNKIIAKIDFDSIQRKRMYESKIELSLPKFRLETCYKLNDYLQALGIQNAFTPDANFSGISETHQIFISRVLHKAVIEVNEEGTEAAAVSAVVCDGPTRLSKKLVVDRPFIFYISDQSNDIILFIGRVNHL